MRISRCAGVSHVTFFNHFSSKEALILEDPYDPEIEAAISALPPEIPPLARAASGILSLWESMPEHVEDETFRRASIIMSSPKLMQASFGYSQNSQLAIARGLMAGGTKEFEAQVVAGACIGTIMTAFSPTLPESPGGFASRLVEVLRVLQQVGGSGDA